eukprot:TRINITY_DN3322_c1_g6_i1.p1 TRINITY_DN3322_c1_g6~~TRINITY_DN3322_c1_g6_i1.p1  ORF type:complete len:55 (+),score=10.19 TRINITY_DN3322_c1_g6_i1:146-310(+)
MKKDSVYVSTKGFYPLKFPGTNQKMRNVVKKKTKLLVFAVSDIIVTKYFEKLFF